MANATVPLICYFEGALTVGSQLYSYLSSVALNIVSYRVLSRDGVAVNLGLYKNGNLLDYIEINSLDTGVVEVPNLYFALNDTFSIQCAEVASSPLEGLTMIFNCTVGDSVDNSALTNSRRIQTPLVSRFEGVLQSGAVFFSFLPSQRIQAFGYTATLRNPADQNVLIYLQQAGTNVATLTIPAGQTAASGVMSCYFNCNEQLTLQIAQIGNVQVGESLLVLLDYANTGQEAFADFQTPFIVEYEGGLVATSNLLLSYVFPRQVTIAAAQLFSRSPVSTAVQVGLYRNGQIQTSFSILPGNSQTQPYALNVAFSTGDLIQVRVLSGDPLASGLLLTLDYFIVSGDNAIAYTYYSDPQSQIVLLARSVGFGGKKADSVKFENLLKYQQDVDAIINGRLRAVYRVPLKKVATGYNPWPSQIQMMAQRMVLKYLLADIYSEVEPNSSKNVDKQAELANEQMDKILAREFVLEGQRLRARNYGSNPYTEPLSGSAPPPTQPLFPGR